MKWGNCEIFIATFENVFHTKCKVIIKIKALKYLISLVTISLNIKKRKINLKI